MEVVTSTGNGNPYGDVPAALEAERAIIGSALFDLDDCRASGLDEVEPDWFHGGFSRRAFKAVQSLVRREEPVDIVSLGERMNVQGDEILELARISESVPSSANLPYHVHLVREAYLKRELLASCWAAIARLQEHGATSDSVREILEEGVAAQVLRASSAEVVTLADIMPAVKQQMTPADRRVGASYVSTGIEEFDEILGGGFYPGSLNILAGRPSMGKTTLAVKIAREVARHAPVLIFSLEMAKEELVKNLVSLESGVNSYRIRRGNYGDEYAYMCVQESAEKLTEVPIYIADAADLDISKMGAAARKLHHQVELGLIVIDYLQMIGGDHDTRRSRDERVAALSRGCKVLAKDLGVPVLLLSQLNRDVDSKSRRDHRPRLSDLRESGSIEQDADTVSFLFRKGYYDKKLKDEESKTGESKTELIVGKQRLGPIGTVLLRFNLRCGDFEQWVEDEDGDQEAEPAGPVGIERGVGVEREPEELPF